MIRLRTIYRTGNKIVVRHNARTLNQRPFVKGRVWSAAICALVGIRLSLAGASQVGHDSVCTSIAVHVLNKISYVVRNDEGNVLHAEFAVTQSQARNPVVGYHVVPTSARKLNYHTRWEEVRQTRCFTKCIRYDVSKVFPRYVTYFVIETLW